MLFSTLFTLCLLNTIVVGKGHDHGHRLATKRANIPATQCFSDNCFRHLLHTPTLAAALCTYTGTVTTTVFSIVRLTISRTRTTTIAIAQPQNIQAYKKRAAFQLTQISLPTSCAVSAGTALTSRVSSACSCLHSESTTVTSTVTAPIATATAASTCLNGQNIYMDKGGPVYTISCDTHPIDASSALVQEFAADTLLDCVKACYKLGPKNSRAVSFIPSDGLSSGVCDCMNTNNFAMENIPGASWAVLVQQQQ